MAEVPGAESSKSDERIVEAVTADKQAADEVEAHEQAPAHGAVGEWLGKPIVDRDGARIGTLRDVDVDVETDEPQFGTVKEGVFNRHVTFVPLAGVQVGPDHLQVSVTKDQVRSAPNLELRGEELSQADASTLYHHVEQNYITIKNESGRRLARR